LRATCDHQANSTCTKNRTLAPSRTEAFYAAVWYNKQSSPNAAPRSVTLVTMIDAHRRLDDMTVLHSSVQEVKTVCTLCRYSRVKWSITSSLWCQWPPGERRTTECHASKVSVTSNGCDIRGRQVRPPCRWILGRHPFDQPESISTSLHAQTSPMTHLIRPLRTYTLLFEPNRRTSLPHLSAQLLLCQLDPRHRSLKECLADHFCSCCFIYRLPSGTNRGKTTTSLPRSSPKLLPNPNPVFQEHFCPFCLPYKHRDEVKERRAVTA